MPPANSSVGLHSFAGGRPLLHANELPGHFGEAVSESEPVTLKERPSLLRRSVGALGRVSSLGRFSTSTASDQAEEAERREALAKAAAATRESEALRLELRHARATLAADADDMREQQRQNIDLAEMLVTVLEHGDAGRNRAEITERLIATGAIRHAHVAERLAAAIAASDAHGASALASFRALLKAHPQNDKILESTLLAASQTAAQDERLAFVVMLIKEWPIASKRTQGRVLDRLRELRFDPDRNEQVLEYVATSPHDDVGVLSKALSLLVLAPEPARLALWERVIGRPAIREALVRAYGHHPHGRIEATNAADALRRLLADTLPRDAAQSARNDAAHAVGRVTPALRRQHPGVTDGVLAALIDADPIEIGARRWPLNDAQAGGHVLFATAKQFMREIEIRAPLSPESREISAAFMRHPAASDATLATLVPLVKSEPTIARMLFLHACAGTRTHAALMRVLPDLDRRHFEEVFNEMRMRGAEPAPRAAVEMPVIAAVEDAESAARVACLSGMRAMILRRVSGGSSSISAKSEPATVPAIDDRVVHGSQAARDLLDGKVDLALEPLWELAKALPRIRETQGLPRAEAVHQFVTMHRSSTDLVKLLAQTNYGTHADSGSMEFAAVA